MKQRIMEEIVQQMLPHLDNTQLQKLQEVLFLERQRFIHLVPDVSLAKWQKRERRAMGSICDFLEQ